MAHSAPQQSSNSIVVVGMLVVAALVSAGLGVMMLTQATMGVGLIGGACLFAILARLAQAGAHHRVLARLAARAEVDA